MSVTIRLVQQHRSYDFMERNIRLTKKPIRLGRLDVDGKPPAADNGVFDTPYLTTPVSRKHAVLWAEGAQVYIRDTDSLNGTFLNGERLISGAQHTVENGDIIRLGIQWEDEPILIRGNDGRLPIIARMTIQGIHGVTV